MLMDKDMHSCGMYALALAAGIPERDAAIIAYASQFVDDAVNSDSGIHEDGGLLFGITTAHHPAQSIMSRPKDYHNGLEQQRKVWVPFHFFPGGRGETFREKILCVKDSDIVREMLENHLAIAQKKIYGLELIGISAHVYADTFSHYDFSGMSSPYNDIVGSFEVVIQPAPDVFSYITAKTKKFMANVIGSINGTTTGMLGHAAVATWPDRPYLNWSFTFTLPRPNNETVSNRDNQATFFEECEKLHYFFMRFAKMNYGDATAKPFDEISPLIKKILAFEGKESERMICWEQSGLVRGMPEYCPQIWEDQKRVFTELKNSSLGIQSHIYRFHQAAAYHRYYVLKDLLPAHGIAVY